MDLDTILSLVEFSIQEEPAVQVMLTKLFSGGNPTPEQWEAVRADIASMSYAKLVPNSQIPSGQ
jgi:hypothetical protein